MKTQLQKQNPGANNLFHNTETVSYTPIPLNKNDDLIEFFLLLFILSSSILVMSLVKTYSMICCSIRQSKAEGLTVKSGGSFECG